MKEKKYRHKALGGTSTQGWQSSMACPRKQAIASTCAIQGKGASPSHWACPEGGCIRRLKIHSRSRLPVPVPQGSNWKSNSPPYRTPKRRAIHSKTEGNSAAHSTPLVRPSGMNSTCSERWKNSRGNNPKGHLARTGTSALTGAQPHAAISNTTKAQEIRTTRQRRK